MCDTMNSTVTSYRYGDNFTKIPKIESTLTKLNSNPTFPSSNSTMGCKNYSLSKLFKNPRKKYQNFINFRHNSRVFHSNEFNFSPKLSLNEENGLNLEFRKENDEEIDDCLKVFEKNDGGEVVDLSFDEVLKAEMEAKAKAKDGFLSGRELREEEEEEGEVEEVLRCETVSQESYWKKSGELMLKSGRNEVMKRSSLLAKQVIGVNSGFSLGFVSQIWVDPSSWVVLEIEVKPSLLSSVSGKVLLEHIERVGDVVLVQDEAFVLNEFRTVGLETLVGYRVLTPKGRNLGKVRGYFFNINSGAVESLELDAFGNSLIPTNLVSTYALLTEDVLHVVSDAIIVHETAPSHLQRLTKGFLSMMNPTSSNFYREYDDFEEQYMRPVKRRKSRRKPSKRKPYGGTKKFDDDLDLPMDYM